MNAITTVLCLAGFSRLLVAQSPQPPTLDSAALRLLRAEATDRSSVMEIASWLTDVHGSRLTNSPGLNNASDWIVATLGGWGLERVERESWGSIGAGWSNQRVAMHLVTPASAPLIAYPAAFSRSTNGVVRGSAAVVRIADTSDFKKYRGQLRNTFAFVAPARVNPPAFEPPARRFSEDDLQRLERPEPSATRLSDTEMAAMMEEHRRQADFGSQRDRFLAREGVLAIVTNGRGDGGTVFPSSMAASASDSGLLPVVAVAAEHYGRVVRIVEKGLTAELELELRNTFYPTDTMAFNIVADIEGSDPDLKHQVVAIGAHLDSWHSGTGATDNAAGVATMMEVMRVLRRAGLPLKRTVRLMLWTGEEQGLLGSRAYVRRHLADRATGARQPGFDQFSVYLNLDNGTGKIRGLYLQGHGSAAVTSFAPWVASFRTDGVTTLSSRATGGTDHMAFDAVGLPGFQFIQDPIEYGTRTHHSNMDTFDRLQAADLRHNVLVVAALVHHLANTATQFPRKTK